MPVVWVDPYIRKGYPVRGHLKTIKGRPHKSWGDKKREWAQDLGYSVTRAARAMYLGVEQEWEIFCLSNPTWKEWSSYWAQYGN